MRRSSGTHFASARSVSFLIVALFFGGVTAAQDAPGDKRQKKKRPFAERVNEAIDRGAAWLKARQLKDGSWGPCVASGSYNDPTAGRSRSTCHETGPTSFSLFTLAMCGMNKKDPVARRGLKWLAKHGRDARHLTSYELSSIVLMLCAFHEPERIVPVTKNPATRPHGSRFSKREWRFMHTHLQALIGPEYSCVRESGGFGYWPRRRDYADVSASQFALLALRSAVRAGYPVERVKPGVWSRAAKYIADLQQPNGGVPYHEGKAVSPGITAGALASLVLCREQIIGAGAKPPTWLDESMKRGRARLDEVFNVAGDRRTHYHYCHLYAIERVGMLSGKKVLGGKDWYMHGANWLLSEQRGDMWVDRTCMDPEDVLGTCFALLFLKRATIPVITPAED